MDYQDIITVELDKRGGQPCIRGLRITVYDVLSYLASGMTEDDHFRLSGPDARRHPRKPQLCG
jgi:uncharacterized protein (DUF433 family)